MNTNTEKTEASATEVDGTPKRTQSEQLRAYKTNYESYQTPNGSISMDNGDDVALVLRGASPEAVMAAAEKLKGLEPGTLVTRYKKLNPGARRMNSGNQIRAMVKKGEIDNKKVIATIKAVSKILNKVTH